MAAESSSTVRAFEAETIPGGLLGADYEIANGRYRIKRVYTGESWNPQLQAPLAAPGLNVSPGDYLLEASPRPRPASSRSLPRSTKPELADIVTYYPRAADPADASALRLGPGEVHVEMKLLRVASVQISGRVIDPGEGTAPPFVQLVARNAAGTSLQVEAPTSQDGPFLIRNVPPGSYYLTAQRSAPQPAQPSVSGTSTFMGSPSKEGNIMMRAALLMHAPRSASQAAGMPSSSIRLQAIQGRLTDV